MKTLKVLMMAALTILSVAVFAQDTTKQKMKTKMMDMKMMDMKKMKDTVYTCPMHPEITSDKPGKCPKCGMKLVPSKKQKTVKKEMVHAATYTCPMHAEITTDKPGKCPKCGMALVEKKKIDSTHRRH